MYKDATPCLTRSLHPLPTHFLWPRPFPASWRSVSVLSAELSCGSSLAGPQIFISDLAPAQCRGENRSRFPLISICLTALSSLLLASRERRIARRRCTAPLPEDNETRSATRASVIVPWHLAGYLLFSFLIPRSSVHFGLIGPAEIVTRKTFDAQLRETS